MLLLCKAICGGWSIFLGLFIVSVGLLRLTSSALPISFDQPSMVIVYKSLLYYDIMRTLVLLL